MKMNRKIKADNQIMTEYIFSDNYWFKKAECSVCYFNLFV